MYTPSNLRKWSLPKSYIGDTWYEYYCFLGRHRDSDLVDVSNFEVALKELGGESDTVIVEHCSHFLVGWVDTILIHESDEEHLKLADDMKAQIDDYPILDEMDHSQREWDAACKWWDQMGLRERIRVIDRYLGPECILGARFDLSTFLHKYEDNSSLFQYLANGM